jgi:SAM-dependent methyltransferase
MGYAKSLKVLFAGITLDVEDLFFLESFQIKYLPDRLTNREFAVLLKAHPMIHKYFASACPSIGAFSETAIAEHASKISEITDKDCCDELLWEIADLIVYNKYPELYDTRVEFVWDVDEIIAAKHLAGKIVIDAGAGSGKLAFLVAQHAETVFAVEPAQGFRRFIRDKENCENVKNIFVVDGFLDSLPFPNELADVLMTSQAIGWNLQDELQEIERVLKPNGRAIHLFKNFDLAGKEGKSIHESLISEWDYECFVFHNESGSKHKYVKIMGA